MIPADNWSIPPCLVSSGIRNISLGGVKATLLWLSCGTVVEADGRDKDGSVNEGSVNAIVDD